MKIISSNSKRFNMLRLPMIPVVLVFVFLQRFITTGIAGTGLK